MLSLSLLMFIYNNDVNDKRLGLLCSSAGELSFSPLSLEIRNGSSGKWKWCNTKRIGGAPSSSPGVRCCSSLCILQYFLMAPTLVNWHLGKRFFKKSFQKWIGYARAYGATRDTRIIHLARNCKIIQSSEKYIEIQSNVCFIYVLSRESRRREYERCCWRRWRRRRRRRRWRRWSHFQPTSTGEKEAQIPDGFHQSPDFRIGETIPIPKIPFSRRPRWGRIFQLSFYSRNPKTKF